MPPKPPAQQMGELHEVYLADVNGGRKSRASGSQWDDQGDGRNGHDGPFAFCWDGKSTRGQQIAVTLAMIAKIREQAQGERPQIGLRWYGNDLLDKIAEDWVAVQAEDWRELLEAGRQWAELQRQPAIILQADEGMPDEELDRFRVLLEDAVSRGGLSALVPAAPEEEGDAPDLVTRLRAEIDQLRDEAATMKTAAETANSRWADAMNGSKKLREEISGLRDDLATRETELEGANSKVEVMARALQGDGSAMAAAARSQAAMEADLEQARGLLRSAGEELASAREELDRYRAGKVIPPYVPRLPWTVVFRAPLPGAKSFAIRYAADGAVTRSEVSEIRVERHMGNRPRLIVDNLLVPDGDLYADGVLRARAWRDNRDGEAG